MFVLKVTLVPRVFRMPQPWSRSISISQKGTVAPPGLVFDTPGVQTPVSWLPLFQTGSTGILEGRR